MTRVLVVEDDPGLARALAITLRARRYDVVVAHTGAAALDAAASRPPDLVILDLGLPDIDGMDVLHALRGWTSVPVVVLSARHGSADKVQALDAGADDYVTKPFGMDELLARIRAATRRAPTSPSSRPVPSPSTSRCAASPATGTRSG
jgi:two-component system KDP operon response regulator KdpE